MDASFDGIIIGAGHNGLILQAYLGRLGLRLLSIDRNLQPGGGLSRFGGLPLMDSSLFLSPVSFGKAPLFSYD